MEIIRKLNVFTKFKVVRFFNLVVLVCARCSAQTDKSQNFVAEKIAILRMTKHIGTADDS